MDHRNQKIKTLVYLQIHVYIDDLFLLQCTHYTLPFALMTYEHMTVQYDFWRGLLPFDYAVEIDSCKVLINSVKFLFPFLNRSCNIENIPDKLEYIATEVYSPRYFVCVTF